MRFAIGYQLAEAGEEPFVDIVGDYREHVAEVYFPWPAMPSGRAVLGEKRGRVDWSAQERLEEELREIRRLGVGLDLLLNASCYGGLAASRYLEKLVVSVLERLGEVAGGADVVTTTSLAVARAVKRSFPRIQVRASVNMRIGTVKGMRHVAGLFDGYCVQREQNRDLAQLHELKRWADSSGKKLRLLANSGCLNYCAGQTSHDNMVAHEREIDETENIPDWTPHVCWNAFRHRTNWEVVLQNSWIRPEDLHRYEELFDVVKLATRQHGRPRAVIRAYAERRFSGNLLDLFEPGFSPAFAPYVIDNERFPADWFERTSSCDKRCHACGYCREVLGRVMTRVHCGEGALPPRGQTTGRDAPLIRFGPG